VVRIDENSGARERENLFVM